MKKLECYYLSKGKRKPAMEFIDTLDPWSQRKFFIKKELLEEYGHRLPQPHAKYITDGIFELRFAGIEGQIRILYFFYQQDKVIFTNGFIKKSQKIPRNPLRTAINDRIKYLKNQGNEV